MPYIVFPMECTKLRRRIAFHLFVEQASVEF